MNAVVEHHLLAVGINRFQDKSVRDLHGCHEDVWDICDVLQSIFGWTSTAFVSAQARKKVILDYLRGYETRATELNLVILFGTHGVNDGDVTHLLAHDSRLGDYSTMIRPSDIAQAVRAFAKRMRKNPNQSEFRARVLLIQDCCQVYADVAFRGVAVQPKSAKSGTRNVAGASDDSGLIDVLAWNSCCKGRPAAERKFGDEHHGVFSRELERALRAGQIEDFQDVHDHVNKRLVEVTKGEQEISIDGPSALAASFKLSPQRHASQHPKPLLIASRPFKRIATESVDRVNLRPFEISSSSASTADLKEFQSYWQHARGARHGALVWTEPGWDWFQRNQATWDPVAALSWWSAVAFCNWATWCAEEFDESDLFYGADGDYKNIDLKKQGFRLPSEWEFRAAARAGAIRNSPRHACFYTGCGFTQSYQEGRAVSGKRHPHNWESGAFPRLALGRRTKALRRSIDDSNYAKIKPGLYIVKPLKDS